MAATNMAGQNHDRLGNQPSEPHLRPNALTSKLTSMLSTSCADLDVREALDILDQRGVSNTPEARRQLKSNLQKEVIDCNGEIIQDFGQVAQVRWAGHKARTRISADLIR